MEIFGSQEYSILNILIWHKTFRNDFSPKAPTPTTLKQPTQVHINNVQIVVRIWKKLKIQLMRIQFNILAYLAQNILWMLNRLQTTVIDVYEIIKINLWHESFWLMAFHWWIRFSVDEDGHWILHLVCWFPMPLGHIHMRRINESTCTEIMKIKLLICFQFKYFRKIGHEI